MATPAKPTILVVDDSEAARYATARILRREGFEVLEAASGTQALRLAAERPALVVLDVKLPDLDGFEVCRRLRASASTASIPVLHLSATYTAVRDRVRGLEAGADAYLTTPVEPEELIATVRTLLRLRQAEADLRESETRFRTLVESVDDVVFTLDRDQRHTGVFGRWLEKLGVTPGDFLGRTAREILGDRDASVHEAANLRALAGEHVVYEWSVSRGSQRWHLQTSVSPLVGDDGRITGVVGVGRDITARLQAEQSARALADAGRDFVATLDFGDAAKRVVAAVLGLFRGRRATLFRLEPASGLLVCVAHAGETGGRAWIGDTVRIGEGIAGRAVVDGAPIWSPDVVHDDRFMLPPWLREVAERDHIGAVAAAPLRIGDEVVGALNLVDSTGRVFVEPELRLLAAFAGQAALALRNARLHTEVKAARDMLQSIVQNSADAIVATDLAGRVTHFSPGAEDLFGLPAASAIGRSVDDRFEGGHEEVRALERRLHAGERIRGYETRIRIRDRGWVDVSLSMSLMRDPDGEAVGVVAVGRDLTEQRRMERALQITEARLQAALETLPFDFWLTDADGRYILLNSAAIARWGDWIGRRPSETSLPPEIAARWEENNARALAGEVIREEAEYALDGETRSVDQVIGPFSVGGAPGGTVGISIDITDRKRAEAEADRQRRATETLADLVNLVSRSLDPAEVAHRIVTGVRTLLRAPGATVWRLEQESGSLSRLAESRRTPPAGRTLGVVPPGVGVIGRAVREAAPVVTTDVLADPRIEVTGDIRRHVAATGFRAIMAVPMLARGVVIGVLGVGDHEGRVFTDDDTRLAQAFADHVVVALENSRLYAETEQRRAEVEVLAELMASMNRSLDLDTTLQQTVEGARRLLACERTAIALRAPSSGLVRMRYFAGSTPDLSVEVIEPGRGQGGVVLLTGQALRTGDYFNDSRFGKHYADWARKPGLVSQLVVPILGDDAVAGLLFAASGSRDAFGPRHEAVLAQLADHAAVAIRNAQLFARERAVRADAETAAREARTRAAQQAAVAALGRRALEAADLDAVMTEAAAVVARTLEVEYVKVLELAPDGSELLLRAGVGWAPGLVGHLRLGGDRQSQAAYALRVGVPVIVEDLAAERRFVVPPLLLDHGVVSGVSVAIHGGEHPFGVLGAHATTPRRFTADDVHFLESVANVLAAAAARVRAEAALRASEQRFRYLAASSPSMIYACQTGGDFGVTYVSENVGRVLGWAPHDFLDRPSFWIEHVHPEHAPRVLDALGHVFDRGHLVLEYRFQHQDGSYRWMHDELRLIRDPDGTPHEIVGSWIDVTDRKLAERQRAHLLADERRARAAAEMASTRLRALQQRLVEVQERERRAIARELHDEIGQVLTGLKLTLESVGPAVAPASHARVVDGLRLVDDLIARVRQLSLDLRPAVLDDLGLLPALRWYVQRYTGRTGVAVDLRHSAVDRRFPPAVETAAFRIVQEALTNIARHAGVRAAVVRLWTGDDVLYCQVVDRGVGFSPETSQEEEPTGGLSGMRERARLLGGDVRVESVPGAGVILTAELPLSRPDAAGPEDPA